MLETHPLLLGKAGKAAVHHQLPDRVREQLHLLPQQARLRVQGQCQLSCRRSDAGGL